MLTLSYDDIDVTKLPQTFKVGFLRTTHNKPTESTSKRKKELTSAKLDSNHLAIPTQYRASAPTPSTRVIKPTFLPLHSHQQDKITPKRSSIRPPELYFQSNPRPPPPQPVRVSAFLFNLI